MIEAYKKEKKQSISLKQEVTKLTKSVDKGREEKLKLKHMNEALMKQIDVLQSETGDIQKVRPHHSNSYCIGIPFPKKTEREKISKGIIS